MENIKEALGGKSPNNQRATRPGVVQMSNDGSASGSVATITAASAGEDCTPPLSQLVAQGPADAALEEEIGGIPPQITLTSSRMQQRSLISPEPQDRQADTDLDPQQQLEEVDAIIVSDAAAADTPLESPPNYDGGGEESTAFSQDPQQQALPQEQQVDLSEELLVAEVELIRPGDDNDEEQRAQTTEEQPVSSIQLLTQSSFPVAQVVDAPVEESEDEEEEGGEHITAEEEVGETANIDYSHVVLIQQEVALATTDGRDQDEQDLGSSPREEWDDKCKLIPKRRSKRFVCGVVGVLAVVACVLGAVFAVNNASRLTSGSEGTATDDSKNNLTTDDDMNVVEVLLKAFLEKIGTNDHRIPGTPQYKAIQWLYESAREGSERFNLSEWAIRQLLVQRYVMAVFYYTTGGAGTWDDDCGFVTAKNECEWKCTKNSDDAGITCDESSRIQKILLPNNNLSGPIPIEFKALTSLVELDISNNSIQGQLPEGIGDLQNMKSFNAAHNELTGKLPSSLGNLSFLGSLNLMDNNLTGEIPPEVNRLGSLSSLWLSGNGFTGGMNNFCDSENRSLLRNQHRRFLVSTFYADCSSIACDCCTHCCVSGMSASSCQPNNP